MSSGNLDGFDASTVDPKADFEPVPDGEYVGMAIDSKFEPTKSNDGEFLKIEFEILDGPYRGRRLFDRLNLKNKSEQAVKIAQATLSSICRAVGVLRPRDSSELHGKPLKLKVGVEERNDKPGQYSNRIKNYEAVNSPSSTQATTAQQESLPPWKRKSA